MLIDRNSKNEFVLNCFRELLDDGEPHRYREIIDYVREQAKGTQYEGTTLCCLSVKNLKILRSPMHE